MDEPRKGGNWLIYGLGIVLIGYTGFRTVELLSTTLPEGLWWVGLFALFALDGGVLIWTHYALHHAQSIEQERIAWLMIVLCLGGVGLTIFGDTFYQTYRRGFDMARTDVTFWAIVTQGVVIFCNVVAAVVVIVISPEAKRIRDERRIYHEIELKKLEAIRQNANVLAQEAAEIEGRRWLKQQRDHYSARDLGPTTPLALQQQAPVAKGGRQQAKTNFISSNWHSLNSQASKAKLKIVTPKDRER